MTVERFGLIDDDDIEPDIAALELSALDHEGVDLDGYLAMLQEIADRLAIAGVHARSSKQQATVLAAVLHGEFGFTGDPHSYDAPLNADLIRVLDRRRGLPVSLSILYIAAARRVGWTAVPLNTPGHLLIRVGSAEPVIMDPFHDGRIVYPADLMPLLRQVPRPMSASEQHGCPMSNRALLFRLLLNQGQRAEQAGDVGRALMIHERAVLVAPDNPDAWWQLARLQLQQVSVDAARLSLSSMLEVTRDRERRKLVAAALDAIALK